MQDSTPSKLETSGTAKSSFILGLTAGAIWIFSLFVSVFSMSSSDLRLKKVLLVASGGLILISVVLILVGFVFGIVSLKQNIANRWMATAGTIINGALIAIILCFMVFGILHKKMPPNTALEPTRITLVCSRGGFLEFGHRWPRGSAFGR